MYIIIFLLGIGNFVVTHIDIAVFIFYKPVINLIIVTIL